VAGAFVSAVALKRVPHSAPLSTLCRPRARSALPRTASSPCVRCATFCSSDWPWPRWSRVSMPGSRRRRRLRARRRERPPSGRHRSEHGPRGRSNRVACGACRSSLSVCLCVSPAAAAECPRGAAHARRCRLAEDGRRVLPRREPDDRQRRCAVHPRRRHCRAARESGSQVHLRRAGLLPAVVERAERRHEDHRARTRLSGTARVHQRSACCFVGGLCAIE
jgi:hypothetical protein